MPELDAAPPETAPPASATAAPAASTGDHLADPLARSGLGNGPQAQAQAATSGAGGDLPHKDRIQASFGQFDVSGVSAHTGTSTQAALRDMGAKGLTTGDQVALKNDDLHTAAHEAAHAVQQRQGVRLKDDTGEAGDAYERHADAVADAVVAGQSAEGLLANGPAAAGSTSGGVQFKLETWDPDAPVNQEEAEKKRLGQKYKGGKFIDSADDGTGFFSGVQEDTEEASNLKGGNLSPQEAVKLPLATVEQINPKSDVPKQIIRKATKTNWNTAKHMFAEGHLPGGVSQEEVDPTANRAIMKKLWEYRQWHHDKVLKKVKRNLNAKVPGDENTPPGLSDWAAAGSTSMTSDIDINLKGSATERAVGLFNDEFKKEFGKEAGVVYDVNVYALDFMHGMGVRVDQDGQEDDQGDTRLVSQEGGRKGRKQGGIDNERKAKRDLVQQEEWADLKIRLYMNDTEWAQHKASVGPDRQVHWVRVEKKYKAYRAELKQAMQDRTGKYIKQADDAQRSGYQQIGDQAKEVSDLTGFDTDNVMIGASNDVYEKKLKRIGEIRERLKLRVDAYNSLVDDGGRPLDDEHNAQIASLKKKIDNNLVLLRELISEAALFSNEAYLTDGGVNHTVVGLQIGKPLNLSKAATLHAVQENMADSLKEIGRHNGSIGEAAYKSGKYFWRMADAAKNWDIDLGEVEADMLNLKTTGHQIANDIKQNSGDKEGDSASEMDSIGVTTVGGLKSLILRAGQGAIQAYNEQVRGTDELALSESVDKENPL